MCFSAEASFGASALISVMGVFAIKKANSVPLKIFAIIPLFFAFQQLMEGFLWIVINNPDYQVWKHSLIIGFLIFAWLVWPVYVPFSMAMLEKNATKRKVLLGFLVIGIILTFGFLYILIFHKIDASAAKLHIHYSLDYVPPLEWIYGLIYLIPTIVSMMVSSVKKMWILGLINLASYIFSRIFFFGHVLSVWCFFGALASGFVLWYVIQMSKVHETSEETINQTV